MVVTMKDPIIVRSFAKLAREAGVKVHLGPGWGSGGQVELPNGRKMYFRHTSVELNPAGATEIARDKDASNYFMRRMGYPVVPGRTVFSDAFAAKFDPARDVHAGWRYAQKIGLPVVLKPNRGRQGFGVSKVYGRDDYYRAAKFILAKDNVMLVQRAVSGKDHRIVVLDADIISAYERRPLTVTGNGRSTVLQLMRALQRQFVAEQRDAMFDLDDFRIAAKLRRRGLSLASVPARDEAIPLLDNANLSSGGAAIDVSDVIHPGYQAIAVNLTRDMGLRYCGVDLMVKGDLSEPPKKYWVLEINSAPGLDHFASRGRKQRRIVDELYLKVLEEFKRMGGSAAPGAAATALRGAS
jgi:D-alanine-D-alanine ligase-like ATP-grasp enzyme